VRPQALPASAPEAEPAIDCIQIEPTTRCNFTCGFCCGRSMVQSDIDVERFERALDDFAGARHLELQGEGEPLMHPRFFDMVDLARARGVRVSFITNGSLLSAENVDRLLRSDAVEKVSISLESADGETFRAIRGGKLEKVVAGIERLVTERNARGLARPVVGFSVTLLRRTEGHLRAIVDLYKRLGLDGGMTAQPLQHMPAYAMAYDPVMNDQPLGPGETDRRMMEFLMATMRAQRTRAGDGFYDVLMEGWRPSQRRCPWLDRGLYVNRDGVVTPCCMIKDETHALGRVGVDTREAVLERRDELRDELASGAIPRACSGCEIARYAVMGKAEIVGRALRTGLRVLRIVED
jgi:MoaA/NifB/PqqE/SkfB family radical SAM enzyme